MTFKRSLYLMPFTSLWIIGYPKFEVEFSLKEKGKLTLGLKVFLDIFAVPK